MNIFKKVRFKNIFSVGNTFFEFDLNSSNNTLVFGLSGHGKSTIIEAITFALFGRAYREVKKGQIVNSINKKGLVVELEFNDYKIVRGIGPDKFEIWKGDKLIPQTADAREYQKMLETDILKMDYRTFTQLVILGSAAFTPFMKLKTEPRRQVIEELLDLHVIRHMNVDVSKQIKDVKLEITEFEKQIASLSATIDAYTDILNKNKESQSNSDDDKEREIKELLTEAKKLKEQKDTLEAELKKNEEELSKFDDVSHDTLRPLENKKAEYISEAKLHNKTKENVNNHDNCPTCKQDISDDHKKNISKECDEKVDSLRIECIEVQSSIKSMEERLSEKTELSNKVSNIKNQIRTITSDIDRIHKQYKKLKENNKPVHDNDDMQLTITNKQKEKTEIEKKYDACNTKLNCLKKALTYLKDDGIKKIIIDKYIPILNLYINEYLEQFDLFVSFQLDSEFNETIKSRHRDKFTYASFSEGQKKRIDFSIMMAFREIAKMRNSVSCNLLVVDELLDGLDGDNVDNLESIIAGFSGTNTIFISHSEDLKNRAIFDSVYKTELIGNFTQYEALT